MAAHLAEISHAVLMHDHAGRRMSAKIANPANITVIPLPLRSPEPNPPDGD